MSNGHRWVNALGEAARGALAAGILVLGLSPAGAQPPERQSGSPHQRHERRFIVAFELRADRREEFVWPHPTFPRAPYARVMLAVDEMPRIRSGGPAGQLEALTAAANLRINGRFPKPRPGDAGSRAASQAAASEEFIVELEAGRLHVSLVLPPGVEVDAQHNRVRITVYEVEPTPPGQLREK